MIQLDKKELYELKSKSKSLDPVIRIGKGGISDNVVTEVKNLLRKRRLIKIRVLRNCLDNYSIEEIIDEVVKKCDCVLIDKIGLVFSIYN